MKTTLRSFLLLRLRIFFYFFFLITCLLLSASVTAQTVTTGKSYINITRPNGGTFLPGDIIEVRATIAITGGSNTATTRLNAVRYNDTINLAKFDYIAGTLRMLSNEGRLQRQYSDGADTDSAHINIPTGVLRFNIGNGAGAANVLTQGTSTTNAGAVWGSGYFPPSFYGNTCIRVYSYRIQLKTIPAIVNFDTTVVLNAGNFRYRMGSSSTDLLSNFNAYQIKISPDYGLCTNSIGGNALIGESGGTFGSGIAQNKAGGTSFVPAPYTFVNFAANSPNDNYYGLANRTSATGSTNPYVAYPNSNRVFTVWDIIGDHTGAADPYQGNPPTNTGYAVIINASYETNRAFSQPITNVCEETYYEFSAWFRNICRRCGCDSSGKGAGQTGYVPSTGNDSSGVRPNLTFQIDGQDYYTTGNIAYSGKWVKKGFVFRTKPGQTSFTLTIRNNAPGGGGNDWAIDDIAIATCLPNMKYSPSLSPTVCAGAAFKIYDTVKSYFNNYVYYRWQRSVNGLAGPWLNVTTPAGPVTPYVNSSNEYEYVTSYTVPPAFTTVGDAGDMYRVIVATSLTNLSDINCRTTDPSNIVTLNIIDCDSVLSTKITGVNGKTVNTSRVIKWATTDEEGQLYFDIERSVDGISFTNIATLQNDPQNISSTNNYSYTDPQLINGRCYYRIRMRTIDNRSVYSRILQLNNSNEKLSFGSVINPFTNTLYFDISATKAGKATASLTDQFGRPLKIKTLDIKEGVTQFSFENTGSLLPGVYILRTEMNEKTIYTKLIKL